MKFIILLILLTLVTLVTLVTLCNAKKNVHVIMSTHLDVGYSSPYANKDDPPFSIKVINDYMTYHFPQILINIKILSNRSINYIYTTHAYLVYIFIHCDPLLIPSFNNVSLQCPNTFFVTEFRQAIYQGQITWHAFPFNTHMEMQNGFMVDNQIKFVHALDDEFNLPHKTVISQRDVPGMTAGAIPVFLRNGIKAVSIGVNAGASAPNVPPIFRWKHPYNPNCEIIGLLHPGGYGGFLIKDAVIIPDFDDILVFYWRTDNTGGGNHFEITNITNMIQKEFPNATVFPSSFEKYIASLDANIIKKLPIVQAEIGDSWIHGTASDPKKLQYYRNIIKTKNIKLLEMFKLLKVSEHTFGVEQNHYLDDNINWDNDSFNRLKTYPEYQLMAKSWIEQRNYLSLDKFKDFYKELDNLHLQYLNITQPIVINPKLIQSCNGWNLSIINGDTNLIHHNMKFNIGFSHQTLDEMDMDNYVNEYCYESNCPDWFNIDFGKPGLSLVRTKSGIFKPIFLKGWKSLNQCQYLLQYQLSGTELYGPPEMIYLNIKLFNQTANLSLILLNKTSSRMPEAFWFSINPYFENINNDNWFVHKVDSLIPINSAVNKGTMHLHGINQGVYYLNKTNTLQIYSEDAGVVSLGIQQPFATPFKKINITDGIHFLLYTNVWNTNYASWYPFTEGDENLVYRFAINL
ncbi:glycoside hydrolase family 38 [Klosneuvirus KNV1]|uniref:Glycoside hydrolase family 38 n=1 Tax=Klosneuvirus KNV1 TaxID=1977640 RepID=A0A1V0SJV7_9VIRU|nr:glycoside hydrolase family 38 [Klosneuvirus KNV1]